MTEKEQEVDGWTEALDKPTHTDIRTYRQSERVNSKYDRLVFRCGRVEEEEGRMRKREKGR